MVLPRILSRSSLRRATRRGRRHSHVVGRGFSASALTARRPADVGWSTPTHVRRDTERLTSTRAPAPMSQAESMSNDRISKEAVALGAAVLLVGGSMLLAGQSQQPTDRTGAKASSPSFVVAVNSSSGAAASAAWNASGMTNLPGDVLVLPPSTSTACPERISDAARAGGVISSSAGCSARIRVAPRRSTPAAAGRRRATRAWRIGGAGGRRLDAAGAGPCPRRTAQRCCGARAGR